MSSFFDMAPPFTSVVCCVNHHGDEMTTQAFKKRIYEVKFKTYFVLEPSNLIKNQRLVSYLNSIYNPMVEARTSNYLDEIHFCQRCK